MNQNEQINKFFRFKCYKGLKAKGLDKDKKYIDRLEYELSVIEGMGFPSYFLIVCDFLAWARSNGILTGPGRGSVAGSLVAFSLGITQIDPLKYDLLFDRFLNSSRITLPDIDCDFPDDRRDEVINYVTSKYGSKRVSHISTYGTLKCRGAIRAVSRVFNADFELSTRLTKLTPPPINGVPPKLSKCYEDVPELAAYHDNPNTLEGKILNWADKIENRIDHIGSHASGIVISDVDLQEIVPLNKDRTDNICTQWDMNEVEKVGLVKFDFLGLTALRIVSKAIELIKRNQGVSVNIETIPEDDKQVFVNLQRGDTAGIFQIETSAGIKELMIRMKPTSIADLGLLSAIYRPGPLGSDYMERWLEVRAGQAKPEYLIPELEPILKETGGWLVYQEQAIKITTALAGFTLPEGDTMRKVIGKKLPEEMKQQEEKFKSGMRKNNFSEAVANKLWDEIQVFAGYGFNKTVDEYTKVTTINGEQYIKDCKPGDIVYTQTKSGEVVPSKVVALHDHGTVPLWEIVLDDGTRETCTLDHKWLTSYGQLPLWQILQDDLDIIGSLNAKSDTNKLSSMQETFEEQTSISKTQKRVSTLLDNNQKQSTSKTGQGNALRSNKSYDKQGSGITQKKMSSMQGPAYKDKNTELQNPSTYERNACQVLSYSKTNFSQTRYTKAKSTGFTKVERSASGESYRTEKSSSCKSQEIKDGTILGALSYFFQEKCTDTLSRENKTSRLCRSQKQNSHRSRWALALLPDKWRRNFNQESNKRSNVRRRNKTARLEINPTINGTLQRKLWEAYSRKTPITYSDNQRYRLVRGSILRRVVQITFKGFNQGYDLEVDHPEHNFLLASGLCCSNSHAIAYAYLMYQTAWLKTHYPVEYMCAALTCNQGNVDQIIKYIFNCRELGIKVLPPDINYSDSVFTIDKKTNIRFGLAAIKNLGTDVIKSIILARTNSPFKSMEDFISRIDIGKVNKRKLESLILGGALDSFSISRASMVDMVEQLINHKQELKSFEAKLATYKKKIEAYNIRNEEIKLAEIAGLKTKLRSLKLPVRPTEPVQPTVKNISEFPEADLLNYERELLGFYISGHPVDKFRLLINEANNIKTIESIKDHAINDDITRIIAVPTSVKERTAKSSSKKMASLLLEDHTGMINAIAFPAAWEKYAHLLNDNKPLFLTCKVAINETSDVIFAPELFILSIEKLPDLQSGSDTITLSIPLKLGIIGKVHELLNKYKGNNTKVQLEFRTKSKAYFKTPKLYTINQKEKFLIEFDKLKEE